MTTRSRQRTLSSSALGSYRTPGQASAFSYRTSATNEADAAYADGERFRLSPQFTYYHGPLGVLGEYVAASQEVTRDSRTEDLENTAWQIATSWVLTGEDNTFRGVTPKNPFDGRNGNWGALELALRYHVLDIDGDAFPAYADPSRSVAGIQSIGGGLNWYLTRNLTSSLFFEQSSFDGGAKNADREDEQVILARVQVSF